MENPTQVGELRLTCDNPNSNQPGGSNVAACGGAWTIESAYADGLGSVYVPIAPHAYSRTYSIILVSDEVRSPCSLIS